jgi:hypothetical protein
MLFLREDSAVVETGRAVMPVAAGAQPFSSAQKKS